MAETHTETTEVAASRRIGFVLAGLTTLVHAVFAGRYDLFRDELYFIVCGQHPAFGYVDQPPLVPLLAAGLYALGGDAWTVRLPVVLVAGGTAPPSRWRRSPPRSRLC